MLFLLILLLTLLELVFWGGHNMRYMGIIELYSARWDRRDSDMKDSYSV